MPEAEGPVGTDAQRGGHPNASPGSSTRPKDRATPADGGEMSEPECPPSAPDRAPEGQGQAEAGLPPSLAPRDVQRSDASIFGLMQVGEAVLGVAIRHLSEVTPVTDLRPLVMKAPHLLGALSVRGRLIPLFDPSGLCGGGAPSAHPPGFAAILSHGGRCLAIGVEAILGIAHPGPKAIQDLGPGEDRGIFTGGFLHDERVVMALDVPRLLSSPGLQTAEFQTSVPAVAMGAAGAPALVFAAGEATFAVAAREVHATVPRRPVERNSLTSGACLGTVSQHGHRIPVLDTALSTGLGVPSSRDAHEIVVLRFPEGRLLGLAVDTICKLTSIHPAHLPPPPPALGEAAGILSGIHVDGSGRQVFLLDHEALRARADLANFAGMSGQESGTALRSEGESATEGKAPPRDVIRERVRYLVFEVGCRTLATPLMQVVRIVAPPESVVEAPVARPGVAGMFVQDGRAIPLLNLARGAARGSSKQSPGRRLLLVGEEDHRVGVTVDGVTSIEVSRWRTRPDQGPAEPSGSDGIVQLASADGRRLLPLVDLAALARTVCAGEGGETGEIGTPPAREGAEVS